MSNLIPESNRQTYGSPAVTSHYASLQYLTPCERLLFDSYIKPGSNILDLGVGGGRTTPYLARQAKHYVGADYAASMVQACQAKFPGLEFVVADASDLSDFPDAFFDTVVIAFNGIDYVLPDAARHACLKHLHRVLKADGVAIFSSHNPRAIFIPPQWDRQRLERMARKSFPRWSPGYELLLAALVGARVALAIAQSAARTLPRLINRPRSRPFWRGEGTLVDPAHGGLLTHYSVPERVIDEMNELHFRPLRVLGEDYPQSSHLYSTRWYYYVFAKS